jgi:hypothetical protein
MSHWFKGMAGLFEILWRGDNRSFRQLVFLVDFSFGVAIGKIACGPDGDGVNRRHLLQHKTMLPPHDLHGFAPAGLLDQPPQVGLGVAEREGLGLGPDSRWSRQAFRNVHRLIIA